MGFITMIIMEVILLLLICSRKLYTNLKSLFKIKVFNYHRSIEIS